MGNDPVVFDANSLQKKVAERVKAMFSDLIPDAAFDEMVRREITGFFETATVTVESKEKESGYSGRRYDTGVTEKITPFAHMVRECFMTDLRKKIEGVMAGAEWSGRWTNHGQAPGELVAQVTKELVPELVTRMFQGLVAETVVNIRNQMQR